jgi:hypothetical protein
MFSLTMDETPQMLADKAAIIELTVVPVDRPSIVQLLVRLGLEKRLRELAWERSQNWINTGDGQVTLSVNELSGGLRYRLRPLVDEPGTEVKTSAAKLEEIARRFLKQLGRPADPLALERITYLHVKTGDSNGEASASSTLDAGLFFSRVVDDLPVIGPGGRVLVKIGTDETVVGGREIWRPILKRGEKVNLRTPDEANELLQLRLKKWGVEGSVHVRKARMGYGELGIEAQQRYLEPCYEYIVETVGALVPSKRIEIIPAARIGPLAAAFETV